MPRYDWLFVRGSECLWVRRSVSATPELVIEGPGRLRRIGTFGTEGELREFEGELQSRLVSAGWMREPLVADRRAG